MRLPRDRMKQNSLTDVTQRQNDVRIQYTTTRLLCFSFRPSPGLNTFHSEQISLHDSRRVGHVVIRLAAQLGLAQQRLRSIEFIHHNLDELYTGRACKRRIFQQRIEFAFRAHSVRLGFWRQVLGSQDVEKLCPFPKPALVTSILPGSPEGPRVRTS